MKHALKQLGAALCVLPLVAQASGLAGEPFKAASIPEPGITFLCVLSAVLLTGLSILRRR